MKSLNRVQTLAKVLQIISKIVFILSIVGIAISAVSLILIIAINDLEKINDIIIKISNIENVDKKIIVSYVLLSLLECVASLIVSKKEYDFYTMELSLNTPFDGKVVKEIRSLAITRIVTYFALPICVAIVWGICGNKGDYNTNNSGIIIGIVYLLVSLILEYGTELKTKSQTNEEDNASN